MSTTEREYQQWAKCQQAGVAELRMELDEASETHLQLIVHGGSAKLQIIVPPAYSSGVLADAGEVFLVLTMGDVTGKVEPAMMDLNERLEKISVTKKNALWAVLDLLLGALKRIKLGKRCREEEESERARIRVHLGGDDESEGDEEEEEDDEDDVNMSCYDIAMGETGTVCVAELERRTRGHLHATAEKARRICEDFQGAARDDLENMLMWVRIASKPMRLTVQVQLEMAGMIDERIAAGLGLTMQEPVALNLEFSKNAWSESTFREELPLYESLSVVQSSSSSSIVAEKSPDDDIEKFLEASGGDLNRSYGLDVLLPELTMKFFEDLHQERFKELLHPNPFVRLALFIGHQLRLLPGWCLVCRNKLPFSVTRMRTCEDNFCLYRFEELGLGVSVLDEMRSNAALVDLDLSLACCAAQSSRDVFEPFPGFLLNEKEIRGRSGWFSGSRALAELGQANKRFKLLELVLSAIPPIETLASATSERALKRALTRAWYSHMYRGYQSAPHGGPVSGHTPRPYQDPSLEVPWKEVVNLAYDVTRFVLMTNRLSLSLLTPGNEVLKLLPPSAEDQTPPSALTHYQFVVLHDTPEKEAYFSGQRNLKGSFFAFHGSSSENWYSILRNGLRSMSNTSYMSTGSAYGEGIYLAADLDMSIGYARHSTGSWSNGNLKDGFQCVAICEVINGSHRENKSGRHDNAIFVVPRDHEHNVAIRYLLVIKSKQISRQDRIRVQDRMLTSHYNSTDLLAHYLHLQDSHAAAQKAQRERLMIERSAIFLAHTATESIKTPAPNATHPAAPSPASGNLSVMQEFRSLMRAIKKAPPLARLIERGEPASVLSGITVAIPDESNLALWQIRLDPYLLKSSANLYNDFKELQRLRALPQMLPVELEVAFPAAFPFDPPFVRVLSPRFKMHSGHVTVGGSICMELLTASGWSPACNVESLLVQIVMAFVEGEGRLDFKVSREYQESEAREAFLRAAKTHGWKTT